MVSFVRPHTIFYKSGYSLRNQMERLIDVLRHLREVVWANSLLLGLVLTSSD